MIALTSELVSQFLEFHIHNLYGQGHISYFIRGAATMDLDPLLPSCSMHACSFSSRFWPIPGSAQAFQQLVMPGERLTFSLGLGSSRSLPTVAASATSLDEASISLDFKEFFGWNWLLGCNNWLVFSANFRATFEARAQVC